MHGRRTRCQVIVLVGTLFAAEVASGDARLATEWNQALLTVAEAEDSFLTLKGVRTAALLHLAMHDARQSKASAVSTDAASHAAFSVAKTLYPGQLKQWETLRDRWVSADASDSERTAAREAGRAAAEAVLAARQDDGWDGEAEYQWHPMAPGVYAEFNEHSGTPEGFVFGSGWAQAQGFALDRPLQFQVPPPPAIASAAYARAFAEVKSLGRFQSIERTPEQTHIALWWKDFVENSHNRLARDLIQREQLSLDAAIRLLALLNMAVFDAYIASFANKFHFNHWRPYTAIRWAEHDGNAATAQESTWTNTHQHTYAFPSYPSAHGTACAAAMTVLEDTFGADYAFSMRTAMVDIGGPGSGKIEMHPPTRAFPSFSAAATECGLSRVYLGIHFRYDSTAGVQLGRQVGEHLLSKRLRAPSE